MNDELLHHGPTVPLWKTAIENSAIDKPDIDKPDIDKPDIDKPDIDKPDIDKPDIDKPDIDKPDIDKPDIDKPDIDKPDIDKPDIDKPDIAVPPKPPPSLDSAGEQAISDESVHNLQPPHTDPANVPVERLAHIESIDQEQVEAAPTAPPEPIDDPERGYHLTIQELPQDLRPRERLAYAGSGALNTAELLAIILRTGGQGENVLRMSERLLTHFGGIKGLAQATFQELCSVHGIGEAKAAQIQSALELGKRLLLAAPNQLPRIHNPTDIANMLMLEMGLLEQEQLRVVLLDSRNQVIRISTVYRGSLNTAVVRVAEIFRDAIRANSAAIILVHNHPSGDPRPSHEDTHTTRMIVDAGKLLDIDVLDHLVIGDRCFVSMKEKGLGF